MKKVKNKTRKTCALCGAKKYIENLSMEVKNGVCYLACKNVDMCVLKMSYNKKIKNKK